MFVCIQCVYMHTCVFDVLALYEDGRVSLSLTAAGKTSVAPHPLWAGRRDCCMTSHWCLDDLRGHYLLSPSLLLCVCVCVQERISEFERRVIAHCLFESNPGCVSWLLLYLKMCLKFHLCLHMKVSLKSQHYYSMREEEEVTTMILPNWKTEIKRHTCMQQTNSVTYSHSFKQIQYITKHKWTGVQRPKKQ